MTISKIKLILCTIAYVLFSSPVFAIDLGVASPYNAFVFREFSALSSDVQGALVAGGDISINNYSVGDKLDPQTISDVLISGGDIVFPSGRVYYGNIIASGSVDGVGSPVTNGMQNGATIQGNTTIPIDFDNAYAELSSLSISLSNLSSNTTYESQWGGLYLHGDCVSDQQIFNLDGATVLSSHTFQIDCIPTDAYVIFNISGVDVGLTNMSLASLSPHRQRVIFNFYQAQSLTLSGIGVEGTVLAVDADINNPQGVIKGQLIAQSWNGMMQLNHMPFINNVTQVDNQPPIAENQRFEIEPEQEFSFSLQASDPNGDELTYNIISQAVYGQLTGTSPNLTYTPNAEFNGIDTITYTVWDGEFTSQQATVIFSIGLQHNCSLYPYTIEYAELANAEIGDSFNQYSTNVGNGNYSLLTWDGANDTNALAVSFTSPGNSENYINPDSQSDADIDLGDWIQGTPGKKNSKKVRDALDLLIGQTITVPLWSQTRGSGSNLDYQTAGFANIELTDYKLNGQSTISFNYQGTQRCVNYRPVSFNNEFEVEKNNSQNISLTTEDLILNNLQKLLAVYDANDDELIYTIINPPANGVLSGTGPEFTYIVNNDYVGTDEFSFKVNDGVIDSNVSTISITVISTNTPPVTQDQTFNLDEDSNLVLNLNAVDHENDSLTFQILNAPQHGNLSGQHPNLLYTPQANFNGVDSFSFLANDGTADSNTSTATLNVSPVNDTPLGTPLNITTTEDTSVNITLTGTDIDNDALTYTTITQPIHGSLTGSPPDLNYQPNTNYHGIDSFTYSLNDGQLDSNIATINITITPINDAPVITSQPTLSVSICGENYNYTVTASDVDSGDVINFSLTNKPVGMSIDPNIGIISWSAADLQIASHEVTVVATDSANASDSQTYNLQVTECNLGPVIISTPTNSIDEQQTYNYQIQAQDPNANDILNYSITLSTHANNIDDGTGLLTSTLNSIPPQSIDVRNFLCKKYTEKITSLDVNEQILWPLDTNEPLSNIDSVPLVLRLIDSNNDGAIDTDDAAIIVFVAYGTSGTALVAVRGDTGQQVFRTAENLLYRSSTLAAGDIDNDGIVELIGVNINRDGIIVFEHDGTIKYQAPINSSVSGSGWSYPPTIADLDGDGTPEILVAGSVLDAMGNSLWENPLSTQVWGAPIVADIDNDGDMEVTTGGVVLDAITGDVIWNSPVSRNKRFFSAIANLDNDPEAELIFVSVGKIYAFEHTGVEIWRASLTGGGRGGAPTIGQVDGVTVIGVAGANTYDVYRADGVLLWSQPIVDNSSSATGSAMFDFNGDDRVEIAYGDERNFYIYDGATGDILLQIPNISHTSTEYPVVADINGDQAAEILVVQNNRTVGLRAFSGVQPWVNTRSIWNQYGYNINNIDDNGGIPANPIKSWQTHNSYRLNTFPDKHPLGLIDLSLNNLVLNEENNSSSISIQVQNRGLIASDSTTEINIYNGNPNTDGILIASINVPILQAGEKQTLSTVNINPQMISTNLYARIDEAQQISECLEDNNSTSATLYTVKVTDPFGLSDSQRFSVNKKNINQSPVINSNGLNHAQSRRVYGQLVQASDPDNGDSLSYELIDPPLGLQINPISGYLSWLPSASQVGDHAITIKVTDLGGLSANKQLTLSVDENSQNLRPFIISAPVQSVSANENYNYLAQGFDADGDVLAYQLLQAPAAMVVNNNTGEINWQPQASDIGIHQITLEVRDSQGAKDTQNYILLVGSFNNPNNQAPIITSTPGVSAQALKPYIYQIIAQDDDVLIYAKVAGPAEMSVDASTGLLRWIPANDGEQTLSISVSDGQNTTLQQWNLQIQADNSIANTAPFISSAPIQNVDANTNYQYQLIAIDPDADPLNYELIQSPVGMDISNTGMITWLATQMSLEPVTIQVNDDHGHSTTQSYILNVIDPSNQNYWPIISSTPSYVIQSTDIYTYQIMATDSDGDNLSYIKIAGPNGLVVDNDSQSLTWQSQATGDFPVTIEVSDGQNSVRQSWVIRVTKSNLALESELIVSPNAGIVGQRIEVFISPQGNSGSVSVSASLDNAPVTLDENYHGSSIINTLGNHRVVATISDDNQTIQLEKTIIISDTLDLFAPAIDIHSPDDGGIATGFIDINISVEDANLSQWQLSYRGTGDDTSRTELVSGSNNINQQIVSSFDTSLLRNGAYVLILEAIDNFGQASSVAHSIFIEGDLKIGHFQIAFEDLNIGVAGIPVTISRSYDTRDRNTDRAFGKGWSIGYQSLELTESRIPGLGWFKQTEFYSIGPVRLPRYCISPIGQRIVSIRLPDGTLEKFKVMAKTLNPTSDERSDCQDLVPPDLFGIQFRPQGDTNSTLTANDVGGGLRVTNGNLQTLIGTEPANPNKYTLTLLDGTQYQIDQGFNLTQIDTTDGNSIKFTHNGIEHNNGYAVQFIRDTNDRIISIIKPNGQSIEYTYDTQGNLESHTDLNGNTTIFTYILDHFLEEIIDPRGIMVARNEYDADGRLIAHVDAEGQRIEYTHDIAGRTEIIKDRNNNSSIFVYDNAGNVIAETNPEGETTLHEYNDIYLETKRTDPLSNQQAWGYDSVGNQLTETDEINNTTSNTYNNRGEILSEINKFGNQTLGSEYNAANAFQGAAKLAKVTDALGEVTEFHWLTGTDSNQNSVTVNTGYTDANGNRYMIEPIAQGNGTNSGINGSSINLNGLKTKLTYDDQARVLTSTQVVTNSNGNITAEYTTSFEYNANGDIIKTTDPQGNITRIEYNVLNKISASIDGNGNRTEFEYNDLARLVKTTFPDGTTKLMGFDAVGNEISITDRTGRTTKTIYDDANRVKQIILADNTPNDDSDNPRAINTYDAAGRLIAVSDSFGNTTHYEFDAKGNNTSVTDPLGNKTTYIYDAEDRRTSSTDAQGNTTKFVYDLKDNLIATIMADITPADEGDNPRMSIIYDARSRKISETDLAGNITRFEYNAAGSITAIIDALNQRTEYQYDQRGNKISQTDAKGHITTWAYNELSQVINHTLPAGQTENFTYDANGNQITRIDFNGDTTSSEYNAINELIKNTYADGNIETFSYYSSGQIQAITTTQGTISYVYDQQDRVITETKHNGDVLNYTYDLEGNKTQTSITKDSLTRIWNYEYDALNRLSIITDDQLRSYSTEYNAIGLRSKIIQDNGIYVIYHYDEQNRLISQSTFNSSDLLLSNYNYTLSPTGLRKNIAENTGRNSIYVYDEIYRLQTENITDAINGNHNASYQYDPVGNRTISTINGVTTAYSYDNNDQLLSAGAINYQYNANGSMIQENDDGTITDYTYNKKNELVQLTTGVENYQYQYDPMGIRNQAEINGQTTEYLIDHNQTYAQVLIETSATGQTIYTYGDDLLAQENTTGIHYYQYDGLGSTRQLTDENQNITDSYFYDAFGNLLNQTGTTENNYLYTGEQYDPNMGFYYLRARYMNPEIGRFTSMDTFSGFAATPVTLNKYIYANASPINTIDPSGNFGIAEFSVAHKIRGILAEQQQVIGFTFLDSALDPENAEGNLQNGLLLGVAAVAGGPAFKLLGFLSGKFRKALKGCRLNSFSYGTLVSVEEGLKDISEIQIGEKVWTLNEKDNIISLQEVVHTIDGQSLKTTIDITLVSGEVIQATDEHPIYAQENGIWQWIESQNLSLSMFLLNKNNQIVNIQSINYNSEYVHVYNLTVAAGHTYYVSRDEVLVHNANKCDPPEFDWNHIFNSSRGGGLHHAEFGRPPSGIIIGNRVDGVGGFYTASWRKLSNNRQPKFSTFFPDTWSKTKVKAIYEEAVLKAISMKASTSVSLKLNSLPNGVVMTVTKGRGGKWHGFPVITNSNILP